MALNGSREALIEQRREMVASLRLRQRTMREIAGDLERMGIVNPDTGQGFSYVTIKKDLDVLQARWRKSADASTSEHKARQFAELQTLKRQAWADKDPNLALRALTLEVKLMGTMEPLQVDVNMVVQVVQAIEARGLKASDVFAAMMERLARMEYVDS